MENSSRIIFTNGLWDPWRSGGVSGAELLKGTRCAASSVETMPFEMGWGMGQSWVITPNIWTVHYQNLQPYFWFRDLTDFDPSSHASDSALARLKSLSSTLVSLKIPEAGHMYDLAASHPKDLPAVGMVRRKPWLAVAL